MTRTSLVVALAQAHRALLDTIDTPLAPKGASATLAKLEGTLIDAVEGLNTAVAAQKTAQDAENAAARAKDPKAYLRVVRYPSDARIAVINAGSRKALERLPLLEDGAEQCYGPLRVDTAFVLGHSAAYAKAAQKRGMVVDNGVKLDLLRGVAGITGDGTSHGARPRPTRPVALDTNAAFFTTGKMDAGFAAQALRVALDAAADKRAAVAPLVAAIWKATLKAAPSGMEQAFAQLAVIHDPAMAGPHAARAMIAHALAGTKRPHKDGVEHATVEAAIATSTGPTGRKALLAETGDLAAWLANGAPIPTAFAAFEKARASFRAPSAGKRWF